MSLKRPTSAPLKLRSVIRERSEHDPDLIWLLHSQGAKLRVAAEVFAGRLDLNAAEKRKLRRLRRRRRR